MTPLPDRSSAVLIRVLPGARIHALEPYWPYPGRPIKKARIVDAWIEPQVYPAGGPFWTWIDPKVGRKRWVRQDDAERVTADDNSAKETDHG